MPLLGGADWVESVRNQGPLRRASERLALDLIANIHLDTWMLAMIVQLDVATPLWDHAAMTEEEVVTRLKQAADAKRAAEEAAAKQFESAVVEALRGGLKPKTVATATG